MRHLRLFENFDQPLNEGAIKKLWAMIDSIEGNADLDPSTPWSPQEALEWGVGFSKEYGLWHPDDSAKDIEWSRKAPADLDKADKQMENFSNVDWGGAEMGADLDQYVVVMFIENVVHGQKDEGSWITNPAYSKEVDALATKLGESLNIDEKKTRHGRDLTELKYKMRELFYNYSQLGAKKKITLDELISGLEEVELQARKIVGSTKSQEGLWWRYDEDDTLTNTIQGLKRDLELPASHGNHKFAIENMQSTAELENEMKVYFS